MVRMRRALGILPVIALLLAACARGTGAGATDTSTEPSGSSANQPSTSASAAPSASEAVTTGRIDIGALVGEAASYQGQEVTVLGRVDSVLADGKAFTTSPNGDDNNILVIVGDNATVEKDIAEKAVVFITGTVVPFTGDDLAAAGAAIGVDQLADYQGDYVIVASDISDPLNSGS
jgi:hypothetical protein